MLDILNSKDSMLVISRFGKNYYDAKLILRGYMLTQASNHPLMYGLENKSFKEKREIILARNIYDLFKKDTTAIITGQFGSFHTIFKPEVDSKNTKRYIRFSDMLNSDPAYSLTNNKIQSGIILYKRLLKKQWKFYNLDKEQLLEKYKSIGINEFYIENCPDNNIINTIMMMKVPPKPQKGY